MSGREIADRRARARTVLAAFRARRILRQAQEAGERPLTVSIGESAMAHRGGYAVLGFVSGARSMVNARPGAA